MYLQGGEGGGEGGEGVRGSWCKEENLFGVQFALVTPKSDWSRASVTSQITQAG